VCTKIYLFNIGALEVSSPWVVSEIASDTKPCLGPEDLSHNNTKHYNGLTFANFKWENRKAIGADSAPRALPQ